MKEERRKEMGERRQKDVRSKTKANNKEVEKKTKKEKL